MFICNKKYLKRWHRKEVACNEGGMCDGINATGLVKLTYADAFGVLPSLHNTSKKAKIDCSVAFFFPFVENIHCFCPSDN